MMGAMYETKGGTDTNTVSETNIPIFFIRPKALSGDQDLHNNPPTPALASKKSYYG